MKRITSRFAGISISVVSMILTACSGGGGGSVSAGSSGGGGGSVSGSLSVTNVYPSSQAATFATPKLTTRYYVKGLSASIKGTCSRGIASIHVNEGGADYAETASCANDGSFTWSKTYISAQEGNKTLNIRGFDVNGSLISGATATADVRIDNTPPAAPTMVTPASSPFDYTGGASTYTIQVSGASDVTSMTGPASAALTFNSPNYEYGITLVAGSTTTYTFYAYDLAGNQSPGTAITIGYVPSADLKIGGAFLGGPVTHGGSSFSMESSISPVSNRSTDSGTSYVIETGFNYIMNQVRLDQ